MRKGQPPLNGVMSQNHTGTSGFLVSTGRHGATDHPPKFDGHRFAGSLDTGCQAPLVPRGLGLGPRFADSGFWLTLTLTLNRSERKVVYFPSISARGTERGLGWTREFNGEKPVTPPTLSSQERGSSGAETSMALTLTPLSLFSCVGLSLVQGHRTRARMDPGIQT